ncbi:MAG: hypothetical protein HND41_11025 [Chlorobi bacterium]|nr:hypothetical protein [Chlorobiota bacterium]
MRGSFVAAVFAAVACLAAARGAHAQVVISIEGDCPGRIALRWDGATPDRPAGLVFALTRGNYNIGFGRCENTVLGVGSSLRLVRTLDTGPTGSGVLSGLAPRAACGGVMQMIVWHGNPCETSNVVDVPQ